MYSVFEATLGQFNGLFTFSNNNISIIIRYNSEVEEARDEDRREKTHNMVGGEICSI